MMVTPRWVRTRCQPIAIRDVLAYLVGVLDEPRARGRVFEIGGPDVVTYEEMMQLYAEVAGLKRRVVAPVPGALAASLLVLGRAGHTVAGRAGAPTHRQPGQRGRGPRRRDHRRGAAAVPLVAQRHRARPGAHPRPRGHDVVGRGGARRARTGRPLAVGPALVGRHGDGRHQDRRHRHRGRRRVALRLRGRRHSAAGWRRTHSGRCAASPIACSGVRGCGAGVGTPRSSASATRSTSSGSRRSCLGDCCDSGPR